MLPYLVWARFVRSHCAARTAIECVIEEQRYHSNFFRFELIEDVMCIIATVVVADTGVIAPNDKMRTTIVFSNQRMKDCFARAGIAHRRGQDRKNRACRRIVAGENHFVRLKAHVRGQIIGFGFANQRVQEQSIRDLERAFLYVLVGAMNGVACLKRYDSPPTALLKERAGLGRISAISRERRIARTVDEADLSSQQPVTLIVESAHPGMGSVGCAID